ncbi:phosphatase PAP2 family protein [Peribacillus frigoritolerans]|uniref:phosphatase PAP2 family protein n=1 Tax=Peribacillus frigoritolerans TaxID=450367 RepID=UPI00105A3434|nr:phosphatase PAP2 family protein [Peribacillus frigoritolerans]TDL80760.1 phosphatase PAP2 family protein [Peribacillus frigoritolerans]
MKKGYLLACFLILTICIIFSMDSEFTKRADAAAREAVSWVHHSDLLLSIVDGIGFLASKTGIISLLALAIILLGLLYKHILQPFMIVLAVYLGDLLNKALKNFFGRERPLEPLHIEEGFSFPSGHAMVGVLFYGFLIYLLAGKIASAAVRRWLYAAVCMLMLLIGMNRVATNAHFLSDVAGGYLIGLICLILVIAVYDKVNEILTAGRSKKSGVSI